MGIMDLFLILTIIAILGGMLGYCIGSIIYYIGINRVKKLIDVLQYEDKKRD